MHPISVMIKPVSGSCNMRCAYCFYRAESEQRETKDFGIMSEAMAKTVIEKAYDFACGFPVRFIFQGGEPLLRGLDFFKNFVKATEKYDNGAETTSFSIQTNGLLLDDDWCRFFRERNFLVGLSLDGDSILNQYRVDASGKFTTERVLAAAKLLEKHKVDFNVLCVITDKAIKEATSLYLFFKKSGIKYVQFIPCLKPRGYKGEYFLSPDNLADFYILAFRIYFLDVLRCKNVSIRYFDNLLRIALGNEPEQCGLLGHCNLQFIIEANGNVYPCDFYCLDEFLLGNIGETDFYELAKTDRAKEFLKIPPVPDKCKNCEFYKLCRGGCRRYAEDGDYCKLTKKFLADISYLLQLFVKR